MRANWKIGLNRRKVNHKGMTLIEVVVAMAILAIVVTPALRIFASSSGTNLRSRQRQRATTVAEGVMESMKAYTLEQLCVQFYNSSFKGITSETANPASMSVVGIDAAGTELSSPLPLRSDMTLNRDLYGYKFKVQNAASEGMYYDIEATVVPSSTHSPDVLSMYSPNAYSDAIICLNEDMNYDVQSKLDEKARTEFENNFSSYHSGASSHTIDSVTISNLKRLIELDVADDGSTQKVVVKVTYTCEAKVDYHYISGGTGANTSGSKTYDDTLMKIEMLLPDESSTETSWTVYDNSATIGGVAVNGKRSKLDRIFLYYYPNYAEVFGTGATDEIVVSGNLTGLYSYSAGMTQGDSRALGFYPMELVVAKQLSARIPDMDLHLGETGYAVSVTNSLSGSGQMAFKSNLGEYIGKQSPAPVISSPSISGFADTNTLKDGFKDRVFLLYDVEIHVYRAGTTEEVATFTGTMNE